MRNPRVWFVCVVSLAAVPAFAQTALTLSNVFVNAAQRTLDITGSGFDPADTKVYVGTELGALQSLHVLTASSTLISAQWAPQAAGTYVVGVSSAKQRALASYTVTAADVAAAERSPTQSSALLASQFVDGGLRLVRDYALPLLMAFAAVGLVTMALIQAVKDVLPIRRQFHKASIDTWLNGRQGAGQRATLIQLAAAGDETALFELPVAGMMGQLTMASRIVLTFPVRFEQLLRVMAGTDVDGQIDVIVGKAGGAPTADEVERARVRVGNLVERSIDALQISVASRWERSNKIVAFVVSALVTAATFVVYFRATEQAPESSGRVFALGVVTSILAGFVAPVAKDLVTALQNLRKP